MQIENLSGWACGMQVIPSLKKNAAKFQAEAAFHHIPQYMYFASHQSFPIILCGSALSSELLGSDLIFMFEEAEGC